MCSASAHQNRLLFADNFRSAHLRIIYSLKCFVFFFLFLSLFFVLHFNFSCCFLFTWHLFANMEALRGATLHITHTGNAVDEAADFRNSARFVGTKLTYQPTNLLLISLLLFLFLYLSTYLQLYSDFN